MRVPLLLIVADFSVAQQGSDAGFLETVRKAETQAFTAALEESARALVGFLGTAS
jgi:hypothetical protein